MLPLAWLMVWGGAYLAFSSVRGRKPTQDLTNALQGRPNAPTAPLGSGSPGGGGTGASGTLGTATAPVGVVVASATVTVDTRRPGTQGAVIRLTPEAAQAFLRWQAAYGEVIPCTSGWRDATAQQAAYQQNPDRFAPASSSYHTKGRAVDVDNEWLGKLGTMQQSKLRRYAKASGWVQARYGGEASCGDNKANDNEPWHFSYGGCG